MKIQVLGFSIGQDFCLIGQSFRSINRSDEENNPGAFASLNCSQLVFNCSRLILDSCSINRLKEFLIDARVLSID